MIDEPRFEIFCHMIDVPSQNLTIEEVLKLFRSMALGGDMTRPQFLKMILYLIHFKYLRP